MDGRGPDDRLTDLALQKEIESALDVDPSPEFLARVRAQVAREPLSRGWRLPYRTSRSPLLPIAPLVASAIVFMAVTAAWQVLLPLDPVDPARIDGSSHPSAAESATPKVVPRVAAGRGGSESPTTPDAVRSTVALARAVVENVGSASRPQSAGADVLIAPGDARAFRVLLARLGDSDIAAALGDGVAGADPRDPPSAIAIAPIVIAPVPSLEPVEGGVE